MPTFITAADVRGRLQLDAVSVSDTILAGPSFIPYGEAWLANRINADPSTLGTTEQAFAKAAEVAFVAMRVVSSATPPGVKSGPLEISPVSAADKLRIVEALRAEVDEALELLGVYRRGGGASARTSNYMAP